MLRQNPTTFTFLGLAFGILTALLTGLSYPFLAVSCLALSGFFDTIDGSLARVLNRTSNRGAVFDITSDRMVEFSVVLGLYFVSPLDRGFPCIVMLGSILICITSFLVAGVFIQNQGEKGFYYSPGIMERTESFAFFAIMIVFPSFFFPLAFTFSFLVALTGFIRIYQFSTHDC